MKNKDQKKERDRGLLQAIKIIVWQLKFAERKDCFKKNNINDNCRVRLINIVFSDNFRKAYINTGKAYNRKENDTGSGVNNFSFLEDVKYQLNNSKDEEYSYIHFCGDPIISEEMSKI